MILLCLIIVWRVSWWDKRAYTFRQRKTALIRSKRPKVRALLDAGVAVATRLQVVLAAVTKLRRGGMWVELAKVRTAVRDCNTMRLEFSAPLSQKRLAFSIPKVPKTSAEVGPAQACQGVLRSGPPH